jgi:hypothetical protein
MPINLRALADTVRTSLRALQKFTSGATSAPGASPRPSARTGEFSAHPADFTGVASISYSPQPDGDPDPGEIVWTWVPYEEDPTRGKDRPVLVIGHNGPYVLGLMLTSKDHDQDRHGRGDYVDIGIGAWDRQSRPSEAKLGRILQISPDSIRREGAVLDRARFELVAEGLRRRHGWK